MIGLRRHSVRLEEHRSDWATSAEAACQEVRNAGTNLIVDIQHVGSTAVPDLCAKPILDIAAGLISDEAVPDLVSRLTELNYIYRGNRGDEGGHLFVKESAADIRTIHLHAVHYGGSQWNNYLSFRDLLRTNAAIRRQYDDLKRKLVRKYGQDRASYTESKRAFITQALCGVVSNQKSAQQAIPADRVEERRSR